MIRAFVSAVAAMALCAPLEALAQKSSLARPTGSVRAAYWNSTRDLDRRHPIGAGMLWAKLAQPLTSEIGLFVEGWGALRGPPAEAEGTAEAREAYLSVRTNRIDVRIGRQIVAWGRADGINPTGALTAEDLTLLTPNDADRRLGASMATVGYYIGEISITGLWGPEFRGHRIPVGDDPATPLEAERPAWPGDQWAVRAERTGGSIDWSVTAFRGHDVNPDIGVSEASGAMLIRHGRITLVGADLARNLGRFALRAEAAYTRTEDHDGTAPFTKNPFVFAVIGADRTFLSGRLNVNVQYLGRLVLRFNPGSMESSPVARQQAILNNETRRTQHGASMRLSKLWRQETFEAELAGMAYAEPRGLALRPKVTYDVSDHVALLAGAEIFRGSELSVFRQLRPNSAMFLETRWSY